MDSWIWKTTEKRKHSHLTRETTKPFKLASWNFQLCLHDDVIRSETCRTMPRDPHSFGHESIEAFSFQKKIMAAGFTLLSPPHIWSVDVVTDERKIPDCFQVLNELSPAIVLPSLERNVSEDGMADAMKGRRWERDSETTKEQKWQASKSQERKGVSSQGSVFEGSSGRWFHAAFPRFVCPLFHPSGHPAGRNYAKIDERRSEIQ